MFKENTLGFLKLTVVDNIYENVQNKKGNRKRKHYRRAGSGNKVRE